MNSYEKFIDGIVEDVKSMGLWSDFLMFSNCIDMAIEEFGMTENVAIDYVSSIWDFPEIEN